MSLPISFENAGLPTSTETLAKALGQASVDSGGGLDGCELLKLDQDEGFWIFGQEAMELDEGAIIAVNPSSFQHGFISWAKKGSQILGEAMVPITNPIPLRGDLPDTGESWDEQLSFKAQIVTGEDAGVPLLYKSTAHGGKAFVREVMRTILAKMNDGPNYIVPGIVLSSTSYYHKDWKKDIYKPKYSIAYWMSLNGEQEDGTQKLEQEKIEQTETTEATQEAPARRTRRRRGEPELERREEPQAEEPAPTRRRRRRSAG